jgi:hypothetical protein
VDERGAKHQGDGESRHAEILFRGPPFRGTLSPKRTRAIARVLSG